MCPISAPMKNFSFWHYIPLDNDWIDHSYQFQPPNPCTRCAAAHQKKKFCHQFTTKPLITEILKRHLLVAKKVPYNSQMRLLENCWPFMPQTDDLCFGPPTATYSNGHSSENGQRGIFLNFRKSKLDTLAPSCKFLGKNSEYPALQNLSNFSICPKISKSWHLTAYEMAN